MIPSLPQQTRQVSPHIEVKICGIKSREAMLAAVEAHYVGLMFYPPSPRAVNLSKAAELAELAHRQGHSQVVGVFVDPSDELLEQVLSKVALDMIQLHGSESISRIASVRRKCKVPIIKALQIGTSSSLRVISDYQDTADYLLLDAKPPADYKLPGGSGHSIEWEILREVEPTCPWFLAGGLTANNLQPAVILSGARRVDVSSGLERERGLKDPLLIKRFLTQARLVVGKP